MTEPMVSARGLTVRFGPAVILDTVDFQLQPGACLALWGANGAGKTTALRAVLGLVPSTGDVRVAGHDLRRDWRQVRSAAGYLPQHVAFDGRARTRSLLAFMAGLRGLPDADVDSLLERLGLADQAGKPVGLLSGGMQQRLGLAVALLGDPPVLILDEPTSNLDHSVRDAFLAELAGLRAAGKTLLVTSHRQEEVAALADDVLELYEGRVTRHVSTPDWLIGQRHSGVLRLGVPLEALGAAIEALDSYGYAARRNGHGVLVSISEGHRAVPASILLRHGIAATDEGFEVEA